MGKYLEPASPLPWHSLVDDYTTDSLGHVVLTVNRLLGDDANATDMRYLDAAANAYHKHLEALDHFVSLCSCNDGGVITGTIAVCCGRPDENGDCCGYPEPQPEWSACPICSNARAILTEAEQLAKGQRQ